MLHLSQARVRPRLLAIAATVIACLSVSGALAAGAFAAPAVHPPINGLAIPPFADNSGPISIAQQASEEGIPYVVKGDCPAWVTQDPLLFVFASGNGVIYRSDNGGNVEGQATLIDLNTGNDMYAGHTHLWFGDNLNPTGNQQAYFGETGSFQGSAPDGTSLTITANPGGNSSASGNFNEWGQVSVTCS